MHDRLRRWSRVKGNLPMPGPAERGAFGSAIVYGGLVVAIFTSFALISRLGIQSSLKPDDLAALRFGIGGLLLLPVIVRHGLAGLKFRDAAALTLFGGIGFAMLAYAGLSRTPANHGSVLLHGSLPLAAILLASLLSRRWPVRRQWTGSLLIVVGIVVMAWDSLIQADLYQMSGDILLVIAALSWSAYGLLARKRNIPALQAAAIVNVLSLIAYLPLYFAFYSGRLLHAGIFDVALQAVYQGIVISIVSIFAYTRAVSLLGATSTALLATIVPALTALFAIPLLGEWPSAWAIVGIILTTSGMIVALTGA
jgi:drug/metabolite transporter (DMT)-like permease